MIGVKEIAGKDKLRMIDVAGKAETLRTAEARGEVRMSSAVLQLILENRLPKGDVLAAARLAGIQAAKKTSELIPLCHPLRITSVEVELRPVKSKRLVEIRSIVKAVDRTGVEMEALTAVAVACLTVYDMCKAFDRKMVIGDIHLLSKTGGKSGDFRWNQK
ncbi:MAG: cyclic pyranopterin monophosphate synthase MoaC [Candidatus Saccharicenans sp.]